MTNLAQEIFVLSAAAPRCHHRHVAELGNLSYIHVYEWEGGQNVKQAHHTSAPSDYVQMVVRGLAGGHGDDPYLRI